MGARGPAPKNHPQRRNVAARLHALPAVRPVAPPAPAGLSAALVESWAVFWASSLAGVLVDTDVPDLERLWWLRDQEQRARAAYAKRPLVKGSMGQPVANPAGKMALEFMREARLLEDRFGLSPSARLRLGVTFGEASRSLDELNRMMQSDDDARPDPRLREAPTA